MLRAASLLDRMQEVKELPGLKLVPDMLHTTHIHAFAQSVKNWAWKGLSLLNARSSAPGMGLLGPCDGVHVFGVEKSWRLSLPNLRSSCAVGPHAHCIHLHT